MIAKRWENLISNQRNAPTASGIASSRKVFVLPNWSARDPPVNEPTVAPARVELTIHPCRTVFSAIPRSLARYSSAPLTTLKQKTDLELDENYIIEQ